MLPFPSTPIYQRNQKLNIIILCKFTHSIYDKVIWKVFYCTETSGRWEGHVKPANYTYGLHLMERTNHYPSSPPPKIYCLWGEGASNALTPTQHTWEWSWNLIYVCNSALNRCNLILQVSKQHSAKYLYLSFTATAILLYTAHYHKKLQGKIKTTKVRSRVTIQRTCLFEASLASITCSLP